VTLSLWILILAATATLAYLLRRKLQRRSGAARVATTRRLAAAEQAKNDRRDCLAIEQSLLHGAYGERSRPAVKPSSE
jgi:hypothetical protein